MSKVLEKLCLKKLKLIFLFSLVFITLIYTYYITSNVIYSTKYSLDTTKLRGIVIDIKNGSKKTLIVKAKEKVSVIIDNHYDVKIGDVVTIKGKMEKFNKNTVFNQFNYRNYMYSKKIYFKMTGKIEKIENGFNIYKIKGRIIDYINNFRSSSYLHTFILGNSNYIDDEVLDTYRNIGISHLLAISGTHITLLSSLLLKLLNKLNKKTSFKIVTIFLCFYAFLTSFTPSILRAVLMFILININKIYKLKIKSNYILITIACLLLLYNPFYIYNIGFIFSFTISYFLIILSSDDNNYFKKIFKTSLIASLVSIPILSNNFFQINIFTTLFNLVFVPFVSYILFPFSLVTFIIPCFDNILYFFCLAMEKLAIFLNDFNIIIILKYIPFYFVIVYYIVIFISVRYKKFYLIIVLLLFHYNIKYFDFNNYITMLDVGQGDSFLIELKHNKNILIDTGGNVFSNYNMAKNKLIPYFKSRGIRKIDYLILTHGDYDHLGEVINLIKDFKVDNVIFNGDSYNDLENEIITLLKQNNISYFKGFNKLNIGDVKFEFLNTKFYDNENDNSNVIYLKINNYKFLFMGDAGNNREKSILKKYNLKDIDVLKVGHHGSKTSSGKDFINEINPKYSIISVGKNNRYDHPNKEVLNILDNSKIYRTDQDGSIKFIIKNNKLQIETCSP
ncbi:MAG: DNA internalization-related competence protein ComEC/Rec2 [Candidatus Faecisoma sp.]|nr:DNA internalization-related competence protein ComEC/Rec2 [Acholeplasma sp.]MDY2892622.1 DNA internalization-related competence protein ComEC/Rec2 [Candidatus Faecisoma sp.]